MRPTVLSGVDPTQAVKYQIVIMFLIASATGLGSVGVVLLAYIVSPLRMYRTVVPLVG